MIEVILGALHVVNIILVLGLIYLYSCNCRKIRGKYPMGLLIFSVLFLMHCIVGLFYLVTMSEHIFMEGMVVGTILEVIKTIGFVILLYISCE